MRDGVTRTRVLPPHARGGQPHAARGESLVLRRSAVALFLPLADRAKRSALEAEFFGEFCGL